MTKKYRLEIPAMIRKEDARICETLNNVETTCTIHEINGNAVRGLYIICLFRDIPKDWLEEIEEEKPITAEEALKRFRENAQDYTLISKKGHFIQGFLNGEAEGIKQEKHRHEPTQTFEDGFRS